MLVLRNLLLALVLLSTGCALVVASGVAAVGTYTYVQGQSNRTYNTTIDHAYSATLDGCRALGLSIQDSSKSLSKAAVKSLDGDKDVWIKLKALSSTTTEISIRVGYLGDEQASIRIHEAIHSKM